MPIISVDVEVDLSDFSTDDLIEELDTREDAPSAMTSDFLREVADMLKLGQSDRALVALRAECEEVLGVILP